MTPVQQGHRLLDRPGFSTSKRVFVKKRSCSPSALMDS